MSNRRDIQFLYNPHNKATLLDCNFKVSAGDASGAGITSFNGSGRVSSVFMHSSASFAGDTHTNNVIDNISSTAGLAVGMLISGSGISAGTTIASITSATAITTSAATTATASGVTITYAAVGSPNPQAGVIVVNLTDNYNTFLGSFNRMTVPNSGSDISSGLTVGHPYVISVLGTTTTAQWNTAGLPSYITPAVGAVFVAQQTSFSGSGKVQAIATAGPGVFSIFGIGNPNVMNSNGANVLPNGQGMQLWFAAFADSAADAPVLTAPADNTLISFGFYLNNSAQGV